MTTTDKPDSVAATLRAARALIEDPKRWTKHWFAHTANRRRTNFNSPDAVRWCMSGALQRVDGEYSGQAHDYLRWTLGRSIAAFNDRPKTQHADVLDAFDRAIATAEQAVPA